VHMKERVSAPQLFALAFIAARCQIGPPEHGGRVVELRRASTAAWIRVIG